MLFEGFDKLWDIHVFGGRGGQCGGDEGVDRVGCLGVVLLFAFAELRFVLLHVERQFAVMIYVVDDWEREWAAERCS